MKKIRISRTRLKAHWIDTSDATTDDGGRDWHIREYKCDNCGSYARTYNVNTLNFCHGCGARMVKAE